MPLYGSSCATTISTPATRLPPSTPKLNQNQFGLAGGGPVLIPRVYNGKNKTFVFGSYEGTRIIQSKIYNSYTVSPAMLQGDFSGLPTIKDPVTGQPFAGNQIPQSQISGASKFFFPWIPHAELSRQLLQANASSPYEQRRVHRKS